MAAPTWNPAHSSGGGTGIVGIAVVAAIVWFIVQVARPSRRQRWLARADRVIENPVVAAVAARIRSDVQALIAWHQARRLINWEEEIRP